MAFMEIANGSLDLGSELSRKISSEWRVTGVPLS